MKGFPISGTTRTYESIEQLARNQGVEACQGFGPLTVSTTGTVVSSSFDAFTNATTILYSCALLLNTGTTGIIGQAFVPHTLEIKLSRRFHATYYTPTATAGAFVLSRFGFLHIGGEANQWVTRKMSIPIHARQRAVSITVTNLSDVVTGDVTGTVGVVGQTKTLAFTYEYNVLGWTMTDDLNLSATGEVWSVADSIWYGAGNSTTEAMLGFLLREYWTDKGKNWRYRNFGVSGSSCDTHIGYMKNGVYYTDPPEVIILALGANDVNAAITASAYVANKLILINKFFALYKGVKIIVPAILPRLLAARETTSAAFRAQEKLTLQAHPLYNTQLFYIEETGTCFTPTDSTKYNGADGADGTHPIDTTCTVNIFPVMKTFCDNTPTLFS